MAERRKPSEQVIAEMVRYLLAQSYLGEPAPWYGRSTSYADLQRMGDTGEMATPGDPGVSVLSDDGTGLWTTRNQYNWRETRDEQLANAIAARDARELYQGQSGWQPGTEPPIDWRTGRPPVPDPYIDLRIGTGQIAENTIPWAERQQGDTRGVEITYTPMNERSGPPAPGQTVPGPFPTGIPLPLPPVSGGGGYDDKSRRRRSSGASRRRYGRR
jgi:hypothetical protein